MKNAFDLSDLDVNRRSLLKGGVAIAGMSALSTLEDVSAFAADLNTLIVASPQTPQGLDSEFDISLGTVDAYGVLYENLIEFAKIPDPKIPGVMREDTGSYPDKPGGVNAVGKLAESWEMDPGAKWVKFKLRKGVMSNWGNELTAEDVVWSWHRKFELGGVGLFYLSTLGLTKPAQIKAEDKYTVSFSPDNPNPILVRIMANLFPHVFD